MEASGPPATTGWLVLLGGGEFTFGETEEVDEAWLELVPPGPIGFVPAASGSQDYAQHFTTYMKERFAREVELIPIYRDRDARRGRNCERIRDCAAVYLGGGVADHLIEAFADSLALAALREKLAQGGTVVAIAAAAQACGVALRSVFGGKTIAGLGLAPGAIVETNFDPAHDRRLRKLMEAAPGAIALAVPAESALLLGAEGAFEAVGTVFRLMSSDADLEPLVDEGPAAESSVPV
ncbi:MAG: Type 1 glutamine amidotransferase-like domain-containing protein [Thermoanaerobaculia bacterium]